LAQAVASAVLASRGAHDLPGPEVQRADGKSVGLPRAGLGWRRLRGGRGDSIADSDTALERLTADAKDFEGISTGSDASEWINSEFERSAGGSWVQKSRLEDFNSEAGSEGDLSEQQRSPAPSRMMQSGVGAEGEAEGRSQFGARSTGSPIIRKRPAEEDASGAPNRTKKDKKKIGKFDDEYAEFVQKYAESLRPGKVEPKRVKEAGAKREEGGRASGSERAHKTKGEGGQRRKLVDHVPTADEMSDSDLARAEHVVSKSDAKAGAKVVISRAVDPSTEGGYLERFKGLVGTLVEPWADDGGAWLAAFPGYATEVFSTGANEEYHLAYAPKGAKVGLLNEGDDESWAESAIQALRDLPKKTLNQLLWNASKDGNITALTNCARAGADIDSKSKVYGGYTPLHAAIVGNNLVVAARLIVLGANLSETDSVGASACHHAAAVGDADLLNALIDAGAPMDAKTSAGCVPLHIAARTGEPFAIRALLVRGARWDAEDSRMATPLHYAATCGNVASCRLLLEAGASLSARTKLGQSAADKARAAGYEVLADALEKVHEHRSKGQMKEEKQALKKLEPKEIARQQAELDEENADSEEEEQEDGEGESGSED